MAIRIYLLSKELGMENADLIELLRTRGFDVKSPSNTVDNISAASLREEFAPKAPAAEEAAPAPVVAAPAPAPAAPPAAVVRSKEDIERERREREEEEQRRLAARAAPPPVAAPAVKAPPPLPKGPSVIIRQGPPPVAPMAPGSAPRLVPPSAAPGLRPPPVLRTDMGAPIVAPRVLTAPRVVPQAPAAAPVSQPQPGAVPRPAPTPPPAASTPQPAAPPVRTAPPRVAAPPTISAPKVVVPTAPPTSATPASDEASAAPAEAAPEKPLRPLPVRSPIIVRDFAVLIGKRPFQLISELMELGIFASMNTAVDEAIALRIARNHGYALEVKHRGESGQQQAPKPVAPKIDESKLLEPRPPVVCILGHVDHGKTTLLDTIRHTNVVSGEAGGITQHIGAYQIEHNSRKITFIDTPGHAAFSNMRARGANTTDIAVLVVAADDGFMPQTDEALGHARVAKVPVVVAINKMDAPGANLDRVKRQLQERNLTPEDWGGETLAIPVSALKGTGVTELLDAILLQAEVTETIKANPKANPEGVVLEAQKELGRGSTASIIVQKGTLKPGMALVCGEHYCRVRQLVDDKGKPVKEAGPSMPVKVVGWSGPPDAGDTFHVVKSEREAIREAEENELNRKLLAASEKTDTAASIDDLFAAIARTTKKTYRVLVKADVYGTAEALATSLLNIKSEKIDIDVVDMGVGDVTRNDIHLASAAGCSIVAFNVGLDTGVHPLAKHHQITIIKHNIIYELITQVKDAMAELLDPEKREVKVGAAQVRQIFPLAKSFVAGCMVTEGKIVRDAIARLLRKNKVVADTRLVTLKRFKDDVNEVRAGFECGIQLGNVNTYEPGDVVEVFEIQTVKPTL
jgi:translation initiation factor IF-2